MMDGSRTRWLSGLSIWSGATFQVLVGFPIPGLAGDLQTAGRCSPLRIALVIGARARRPHPASAQCSSMA
jgi:hypothetical protein